MLRRHATTVSSIAWCRSMRCNRQPKHLPGGSLPKPQIAIEMGKRLFYAQLETGIEQAYQLAGDAMACNMMHPDTLEGVQAFLEKRSPSWAK